MTPQFFLTLVRSVVPDVQWTLRQHPGCPEGRVSAVPVEGEAPGWVFLTEQGELRSPTTWVTEQDTTTLRLYLKLLYAPCKALQLLLPEYRWHAIEHGGEALWGSEGLCSVTFLELGLYRFCVRLPGQEPVWVNTPDEVIGLLRVE